MSKPTNLERCMWAEIAVLAFNDEVTTRPDSELYDPPQDVAKDLLTDLCHYLNLHCAMEPEAIREHLASAFRMFEAELAGMPMADNPIEAAKALTPRWMMEIRRFDGLEIHPVRDMSRELHGGTILEGDTWFEPCEPQKAELWSVYGHCTEGGVDCLEDFPTEAQARAFAERLLETYLHLRKYGLLG